LGADPEIRYTAGGNAVANIRLATAESWKDKNTGEQQERTEWHRVVFFGRLAEIVGEYLRKGSQVFVEGRIQTRKWEDRDGNERYTTEIVASEMQMLGSRGAGAPQFEQPPPAERAGAGAAAVNESNSAAEEFDDDIPF